VSVTIIGSGATATSAVFATYLSNPTARITLVARNLTSGKELKQRAADSGFKMRIRTFRSFAFNVNRADVVISTLPTGVLDEYVTKIVGRFTPKPRGVLLDVAYHPWPSKFASTWQSRSLQAVSGIEMLIFQAIAQVRVFTSGNTADALPNERAVELAIRDSLGLI
jgi:shikimate dehydrogenase